MSLGRAVGPTLGGMLWSWSLGNKLPAPFDFHFLVSVVLTTTQWSILRMSSVPCRSLVCNDAAHGFLGHPFVMLKPNKRNLTFSCHTSQARDGMR